MTMMTTIMMTENDTERYNYNKYYNIDKMMMAMIKKSRLRP